MTPEVTWIQKAPQRPLCDVPWLGNSVVLADGAVNFCCFSSAVVGNVNEQPFDKVWNGQTMQRIRRALSNQTLPPECQSTSCPIYRGDDRHYILNRMDGSHGVRATGTLDPNRSIRERLEGSRIRHSSFNPAKGEAPDIVIEFHVAGAPVVADLFVAVSMPDGKTVFLPDKEDYAIPFQWGIELRHQEEPQEISVLQHGKEFELPGTYRVCAALFRSNENPNLLSNCYWSAQCDFAVEI